MMTSALPHSKKPAFTAPGLFSLCIALGAACAPGPGGGSGGSGGHSATGGSSSGSSGGMGTGGAATSGSGGAAVTGSGGSVVAGSGGRPGTGGATGGSTVAGSGGGSATGGSSGTGGAIGGSNQPGGGRGGDMTGNRDGGAADAGTGGSTGAPDGGSAGMASAGCGKTPTLKDGTQTIQSGGQNRTYMIRLPKNYDNSHPYWLFLGYHWVGGTANDVDSGGTSAYTWSYYGLREQADNSTKFQGIFVAPQGIGNAWGNGSNSDVAFTDEILKKVEADLCVDTKHVFAMGFSYGGGMTKALGCQRPTVFRGLGVFAGHDGLSGGCDATTTGPVAYWGAHSITDGTNMYKYGIDSLNRFVKNNGCMTMTPPQPSGNTHVCTDFQGCMPGYPVRWCAFNGGGHTPAPVDGSTNGSGGGDRTWTKTELWKFFTQF